MGCGPSTQNAGDRIAITPINANAKMAAAKNKQHKSEDEKRRDSQKNARKMIGLDESNPSESHLVDRSDNGEQVRQKITAEEAASPDKKTASTLKNFNKQLRKNAQDDPSFAGIGVGPRDTNPESMQKIPSANRNAQSQMSASTQPADDDEEWQFMQNMKDHKQRAKNKNKFKHMIQDGAAASGGNPAEENKDEESDELPSDDEFFVEEPEVGD